MNLLGIDLKRLAFKVVLTIIALIFGLMMLFDGPKEVDVMPVLRGLEMLVGAGCAGVVLKIWSPRRG